MKPVQAFLDEYGESHKNKVNKTIHWIFVPLIMFSIFGILWQVQIPVESVPSWVNLATLAMAVVLGFYLRLSRPLFFGFMFIAAAIIAGNYALAELFDNKLIHLAVSAGIFVVSWVFQFIGHEIEGAKPSFFKDMQFFLIGPAWLLHFVYRKLGVPYQ